MARLSAPSEGVHFASRSRPGSGTRSDSLAQQHDGHAGRLGLARNGNVTVEELAALQLSVDPWAGYVSSTGVEPLVSLRAYRLLRRRASPGEAWSRQRDSNPRPTVYKGVRPRRPGPLPATSLSQRATEATGATLLTGIWRHERRQEGRQRVACALVALAFRYDGRDIERARPVRRA